MDCPHQTPITTTALETMIKKAGEDLAVLMRWVVESENFDEKIEHVSNAITLLEELRETMRLMHDDMENGPVDRVA